MSLSADDKRLVGGGGPRAHSPPRETFTLVDYRTRHGQVSKSDKLATFKDGHQLTLCLQYRSHPDLQLLAKDFAWMTTWDDYEVSDNGYRDGSSQLNNTFDSFNKDGRIVSVDQRKMNAVRAYFEWMDAHPVWYFLLVLFSPAPSPVLTWVYPYVRCFY